MNGEPHEYQNKGKNLQNARIGLCTEPQRSDFINIQQKQFRAIGTSGEYN